MSSDDWKAELRRRIEMIKEKKAAEGNARPPRHRQRIQRGAAVPVPLPEEEPAEESISEPDGAEAGQAGREHPTLQSKGAGGLATETPSPQESSPIGDGISYDVDATKAESEQRLEGDEFFVIGRSQDGEEQRGTAEPYTPTLFDLEQAPAETVEARVAAVESRKQSAQAPAAPTASDLEAALDHYTPLGQVQTDKPGVQAAPGTRPKAATAAQEGDVRRRRLGAAVLDGMVLSFCQAGFVWLASSLLEMEPPMLISRALAPLLGMFILLQFLYYVMFTSLSGQTPGKMLFGIKVTTSGNRPLGAAKAALRWFALVISLLPATVGYFWMFAREDGRAWHDILLRQKVTRR